MAKGKSALPDFAENLYDYLSYARVEIEKESPVPSRFIHDDLNPGNILINPTTREVGVIDFGEAYFGDPHFALSKFFTQRLSTYGVESVAASLKLLEGINKLSSPEPWVDVERCIALIPIQIANAIQHRTDEANREGRTPTQKEIAGCKRAIAGVVEQFDRFNLGGPARSCSPHAASTVSRVESPKVVRQRTSLAL